MSEFQITYSAEKVFVHHWPKDSPIWDNSLQKKLDDCINKNSNFKKIIVNSNTIVIENFKFTNLKKIGVSEVFGPGTNILEATYKVLNLIKYGKKTNI